MSERQAKRACFAYWAKRTRQEKALWKLGMWKVGGAIVAECNICGYDYEICCDPEDFDQNYSFCNGSYRCTP